MNEALWYPKIGPHTSLVSEDDCREMVALAERTPQGDFIEVGVYQGGSGLYLAALASRQSRILYLCDTFTGTPYADPEKGDVHQVGDFSDVDYGEVIQLFEEADFSPWVWFIKGIFPESARQVIWPYVKFAFAHLDCDQYRSVKESAEWLIPRMVPGGVIWFDDVDRLAGATRAAEELFGSRIQRDLSHPYVRFE